MPKAASSNSQAGSRDRIIKFLAARGGELRNESGRGLTAEIAKRTGYDNLSALNAMLSRLEEEGIIAREVRGRRTFAIALTDAGRAPRRSAGRRPAGGAAATKRGTTKRTATKRATAKRATAKRGTAKRSAAKRATPRKAAASGKSAATTKRAGATKRSSSTAGRSSTAAKRTTKRTPTASARSQGAGRSSGGGSRSVAKATSRSTRPSTTGTTASRRARRTAAPGRSRMDVGGLLSALGDELSSMRQKNEELESRLAALESRRSNGSRGR
ncbi:MAG TPA: hypothetical protein VFH45_09295 [Acidimicrobiales bacterium]|nr:hypothetical protein [Acidimicrobiales bacterium]